MSRLLIAGALISAAIAAACFVDRKSNGLSCKTQSDCTGNRLCEEGYCVIDYSMCPKQCAACDVTKDPKICIIDVTGGDHDSVTCPSNMACEITCHDDDSCGSITCTNAAACTIACPVAHACGSITCGSGPCDVTCTGNSACGTVSCTNSCACDVTCDSGACGTLSCPKAGSAFCTSNGNNNQPCMSAISGCSHC